MSSNSKIELFNFLQVKIMSASNFALIDSVRIKEIVFFFILEGGFILQNPKMKCNHFAFTTCWCFGLIKKFTPFITLLFSFFSHTKYISIFHLSNYYSPVFVHLIPKKYPHKIVFKFKKLKEIRNKNIQLSVI